MLRIVLLGGPGAGKGTQAVRLHDALELDHISTGAIIRAEIKRGSELGIAAKEHADSGGLVPDELVMRIVNQRLAADGGLEGFILDGYPRTTAQAQNLERVLAERGQPLTHAIDISLPDADLMARVAGRRSCPVCGRGYHVLFNTPISPNVCDDDGAVLAQRDDDQHEAIMARLNVYHQISKELGRFYQRQGIHHPVDGVGNPDDVFARILQSLDIS